MKAKNTLSLALVFTAVLFPSFADETPIRIDLGERVGGPVLNRPIRIRPIKKSGYSFHYIADLKENTEPRTPTQLMQAKYGDQVVIVKKGILGRESVLAVTHKEQAPQFMMELGIPNDQKCLTSFDPTSSRFETPNYVSAGRNAMPAGIDGTWSGSGSGGCGTWATMMCNRILGKTKAKKAPSKKEWNRVARGINQDSSGGSFVSDRANYYENAGYCSSHEDFAGDTASYKKMSDLIQKGCDLKLAFWKRNGNGTWSNGHVEVVTGVSISQRGVGSATTNSWGKTGIIRGGQSGRFSHSEDRRGGNFNPGGNWPANSTDVTMEYVCECTYLQKIAKLLKIR
ncbi:MAG: hypothetical protein NXH75_07415 [Halobacteriovoraceae bacterium]|nr:hypothetical protein [Halobacteriovoraceae bacterium]